MPDGTPAPPLTGQTYTQTARPGARAPHVWLEPGRSTLDLFGRGFTLLRLARTRRPATRWWRCARERGVPLDVVAVASPDVRRLYARGLVLVRPDGHVAWRGDAEPADAYAVIDTVRGAKPLAEGARSDLEVAS